MFNETLTCEQSLSYRIGIAWARLIGWIRLKQLPPNSAYTDPTWQPYPPYIKSK